MVQVNNNYSKLPGNYLFSEVARKKQAYLDAHPTAQLINMGIGDVTRPLFPAVIAAMQQAVDEMGQASSFRGYAPEQGYDFLRQLIAECDFQARGADISADEIFVSDGAKSDCANIGDIFALDNIVAVCDPVYPVYVDSNAMSGRAGEYQDGRWSKLVYLPCKKRQCFYSPAAAAAGGFDLPVLSQQSHRCYSYGSAVAAVGGLCQCTRCGAAF